MRWIIASVMVVAIATAVCANPVIYEGGKMAEVVMDSKTTDAQWFYSLTSQAAVGYRYFKYEKNDLGAHTAQANILLKRWNEPDSQANIYVMGGAGMQGSTGIGYLGAELDWESRRYYTALAIEQFLGQAPMTKVSYGLGIAPYVAEFNELHVWLIADWNYLKTDQGTEVWAMPVIRVFKDNILAEFGSNGVIHYATVRIHY